VASLATTAPNVVVTAVMPATTATHRPVLKGGKDMRRIPHDFRGDAAARRVARYADCFVPRRWGNRER
jgi:hypothetical protein